MLMIIRSCCDPCPPTISRKLFGDIMIYCPICGFTMYGHTKEEAIELWNEKMEGIHHECNDEME